MLLPHYITDMTAGRGPSKPVSTRRSPSQHEHVKEKPKGSKQLQPGNYGLAQLIKTGATNPAAFGVALTKTVFKGTLLYY